MSLRSKNAFFRTSRLGVLPLVLSGCFGGGYFNVSAGGAAPISVPANPGAGGASPDGTTPGAATPSLAQSLITQANITTAGAPADFVIRLRDAAGLNLADAERYEVTASLDDASDCTGDLVQPVYVPAESSFKGSFTPHFIGSHCQLRFRVAGQTSDPVDAEPISVFPGPFSAPHSSVSLDASSVNKGASTNGQIVARDAYGNAIQGGGATGLVVSLGGAGTASGTFSSPVDNGDGTYSFTFLGTVAGTARSFALGHASGALNGVGTIAVTNPPIALVASNYVAIANSLHGLEDTSDDGQWGVYASGSPSQVYLWDFSTHSATRISQSNLGIAGNCDSSNPRISGNGRYVVFDSCASNLVVDDANALRDVYRFDRQGSSLSVLTAASANSGSTVIASCSYTASVNVYCQPGTARAPEDGPQFFSCQDNVNTLMLDYDSCQESDPGGWILAAPGGCTQQTSGPFTETYSQPISYSRPDLDESGTKVVYERSMDRSLKAIYAGNNACDLVGYPDQQFSMKDIVIDDLGLGTTQTLVAANLHSAGLVRTFVCDGMSYSLQGYSSPALSPDGQSVAFYRVSDSQSLSDYVDPGSGTPLSCNTSKSRSVDNLIRRNGVTAVLGGANGFNDRNEQGMGADDGYSLYASTVFTEGRPRIDNAKAVFPTATKTQTRSISVERYQLYCNPAWPEMNGVDFTGPSGAIYNAPYQECEFVSKWGSHSDPNWTNTYIEDAQSLDVSTERLAWQMAFGRFAAGAWTGANVLSDYQETPAFYSNTVARLPESISLHPTLPLLSFASPSLFPSAAYASGDAAGTWDLFVRDLSDDSMELHSRADGGAIGNAATRKGAFFSADGGFLSFLSEATNLGPTLTQAPGLFRIPIPR